MVINATNYARQNRNLSAPAAAGASVLENRYYRVELDASSGAIRSIFDKELNRELVDSSSPYRFNQYVYVTGADEGPNRLIDYSTVTPVPQLTPHAATGGKIRSVVSLPFGDVAWLESSGVNTPQIESEIILPKDQKRIEIVNHVRKDKVYTKEGVYFAFPFAMQHPQFKYAIQNGYIDPAKDILPGGGREWFSVQQWVAAATRWRCRGDCACRRSPGDPGRHRSGNLARRVR